MFFALPVLGYIFRVLVWHPFQAARTLYAPADRYGVANESIDQWSFRRSTAGLVVIVLISYSYRSPNAVLNDAQDQVIINAVAAGVVAAVSLAILLAATVPEGRSALLPGLVRFLARASIAGLTIALPISYILTHDSNVFLRDLYTRHWTIILAVNLGLLVWASFIVGSIYYVARYLLGVGEVHGMLAPICGAAVVLWSTVSTLLLGDTKGVPLAAWVTLTLAGCVTTIVLSGYEYRELYAAGLRLFAGPAPSDRPSQEGWQWVVPTPTRENLIAAAVVAVSLFYVGYLFLHVEATPSSYQAAVSAGMQIP